jgi:transporter family-2 protein
MWIVVAQLLAAYVIELFGWFGVEKQPFEWRKVLGAALAIAGIVLFKWKD